MDMDRRMWLGAVGAGALAAGPAHAIEPIARAKGATMRLSLAAYSFNRQLPRGDKKTDFSLEKFIDFAAKLPLDAVELTSYYFPTTERSYLAARKGQCTRLGLDISGTAIGNDFCVADPQKLKAQVDSTKAWIEHASLMGCKTIRIFAGRVPKGGDEAAALKQCIRVTEEVCEYAGQYGIYLALENHGGITSTAAQILSIVKAVDSPWFGVNLDTGNFRTEDPYGDLAKLAPYSVNAQVKVEISPAGGKKQEADLPRLIGILREVGYRGYVALEYEASPDPFEAVPRYVEELRKLIDAA